MQKGKFSIIFFLYIASLFSGCTQNKNVSISYGKDDIVVSGSLEVGGFIFDTGSTHSVIFTDEANLPVGEFVSSNRISDVNNRGRILELYRIDSMQIGTLRINNGEFLIMNKESLPDILTDYKGIIGMDIIDRANWYIDLPAEQITVMNKNSLISIPTDALSLDYNTENDLPETIVKVGNQVLRNIIIDTGSQGVLELLSSDIRELNRSYEATVKDTVMLSGLYSGITKHPVLNYKSMPIDNSCVIDSLEIFEVMGERRMGFGFFKEFNHIFIDTQNQKIHLYN